MRRWLAIAAGLLAACTKTEPPTAQNAEAMSGRTAPKDQGPRLVAHEVPEEAPFIGEAGTRPDGYPWRRPDKVKLLGLLRMRQFDVLDRFFAAYQDAFEQDYHFEEWPDQAATAFHAADPALGPLLDAWVEHAPSSWAARLCRGDYRARLAWHYRGHAYARKTTHGQFQAMDAYFAPAREDFEQALALRPKLVAAYERLIEIENATTQHRDNMGALLQGALAQCELCFTPRKAVLHALRPRWHGSYELMREFVARSSPLFGQNPRLRTLAGVEDADRCDLLRQSNHFKEANKACELAQTYGEDIDTLLTYAYLRAELDQKEQALALLDRAVRIDAMASDVIRKRAYVRTGLKDYAGAASDALLARQLDATDEGVTELVRWLVDQLRYQGSELNKTGQGQDAARLFSLALQLAPDDQDLMLRMGYSQQGSELGADSVRAQLAAAPDDFTLRQRIDAGLAAKNRFGEVVKMWDAYIVAHLRDPRAYVERAGAHWHLRQIDQALGDMEHACALGMEKACTDVKRMRVAAGR